LGQNSGQPLDPVQTVDFEQDRGPPIRFLLEAFPKLQFWESNLDFI
jgi:hypothetical protein